MDRRPPGTLRDQAAEGASRGVWPHRSGLARRASTRSRSGRARPGRYRRPLLLPPSTLPATTTHCWHESPVNSPTGRPAARRSVVRALTPRPAGTSSRLIEIENRDPSFETRPDSQLDQSEGLSGSVRGPRPSVVALSNSHGSTLRMAAASMASVGVAVSGGAAVQLTSSVSQPSIAARSAARLFTKASERRNCGQSVRNAISKPRPQSRCATYEKPPARWLSSAAASCCDWLPPWRVWVISLIMASICCRI
jgi:hypothetical protein